MANYPWQNGIGKVTKMKIALINENSQQSLSLPENNLFSELEEMIFGILPKYQRPKHILQIESIPLTGSGKIDRAACRKLAMERYTG